MAELHHDHDADLIWNDLDLDQDFGSRWNDLDHDPDHSAAESKFISRPTLPLRALRYHSLHANITSRPDKKRPSAGSRSVSHSAYLLVGTWHRSAVYAVDAPASVYGNGIWRVLSWW